MFDPQSHLLLKEDLHRMLSDWPLEELESLADWLKATIKERKRKDTLATIPLKKGREVLETHHSETTLYRLEKVKCGKKKCKCTKGKLHGPYWYAYHWNGKKLSSTYIGKTLKTTEPEETAPIEPKSD